MIFVKKRATVILWNQIVIDKIVDNYTNSSKNGVDRLQNESIWDLNCYDDDKIYIKFAFN